MVLNFWRKKYTEKRAYERVTTHLFVTFLNGDSHHKALLTNLSGNGIYFMTGANLSAGVNIEVSIPYKNDVMNIPVKITRSVKKGRLYEEFGAKLSVPTEDYLEFFSSLKASP